MSGLGVPVSTRLRVKKWVIFHRSNYIVEQCTAGDLVISADVPLAARAVDKGAQVLQPHGRVLDENNVEEVLSIRDFKDDLRSFGLDTGGPPPYTNVQKGKSYSSPTFLSSLSKAGLTNTSPIANPIQRI